MNVMLLHLPHKGVHSTTTGMIVNALVRTTIAPVWGGLYQLLNLLKQFHLYLDIGLRANIFVTFKNFL